MNLYSRLKRRVQHAFHNGERGSILILSVLSSLIIIGSAGLAVDVGRLYATKAELSRAVDAAALSGVLEFNGQPSGVTNAQTKAQAYLSLNEPSAASVITPVGGNTLSIRASKSVRLYFLPIFGLTTATVSSKASAGFSNASVDAVMVIDSTGSMAGLPLTNAKTAAINFKNTLLGTAGATNVAVGVAPLRGCYRDNPMPATQTDCIDNATQVQQLTSNSGTLDTKINALIEGGISATNICTGLGKGYSVLNNSATNHQGPSWPNNRRFMVLLSDGDNVYFGFYTYQVSPASPDTVSIGGVNYSCQPPSNCTGWGTPCVAGLYPGSSVTVAYDGFESNNWTAGAGVVCPSPVTTACGWVGNWIASGTGTPGIVTTPTGTPVQAGSDHLRLRQGGTVYRQVNLTGVTAANLTYWHKRVSFEAGDNVLVQCGTNTAGPWQPLRDWNTTNATYAQDTVALPAACLNSATVYIRFNGSMDATDDQFYADEVTVVNTALDYNGYLNTIDGQDYTSCSETPKPRERQLDVATLNMANAIKAQNIEIFVVSFSACPNGDGATVYSAAACASQANPIVSAPAAGKVGDTLIETNANARLAKCIASSTPGTNDHYWYSSDATQLPSIFTTIAAQIAHRLVE